MKITTIVTTIDMRKNIMKDMNIQTDCIIGNQTNYNEVTKTKYENNKLTILSFNERGVGLNRNNALMRAKGDIIILADDDMVFLNGYQDIVKKVYEKNPGYDVIIFNLIEEKPRRFKIKKNTKIRYYNFMRFGAARITFKNNSIKKRNIYFSLIFGGGTNRGSGEDTIFLKECLDKKLKILAVPYSLAKITEERESTWFEGYNDKYFKDKAVLFYYLFQKIYMIIIIRFLIKFKLKDKKIKFWKTLKMMRTEIKNEKNKK